MALKKKIEQTKKIIAWKANERALANYQCEGKQPGVHLKTSSFMCCSRVNGTKLFVRDAKEKLCLLILLLKLY